MFKNSQTSVGDAYRKGSPSTSTNEQNMVHIQAVILGNYRVTTAEIFVRLGINVAHPWCKPLV
jgi:hypothetical protein